MKRTDPGGARLRLQLIDPGVNRLDLLEGRFLRDRSHSIYQFSPRFYGDDRPAALLSKNQVIED
jgi:hypothetical protein